MFIDRGWASSSCCFGKQRENKGLQPPRHCHWMFCINEIVWMIYVPRYGHFTFTGINCMILHWMKTQSLKPRELVTPGSVRCFSKPLSHYVLPDKRQVPSFTAQCPSRHPATTHDYGFV